jgi:peptide/nickel transport system substrate-binding protein
VTTTNPYPFSVSAAQQLLSSHGWKVAPGGTTTCQNPSLCGAGISKGEGIAFNIDYASGTVAVQDEMNDLAGQARKVGININLTSHPFATVIGTAVACQPTQADLQVAGRELGGGLDLRPVLSAHREQLYAPGAVANYGSYSDPSTTKLIQGVTTASDATQELTAYAKNVEQMEPVVFGHFDRYVRRRCGSSGGQESRRLCGERVGSHEPRGLVLHEVVRPRSSCSRDVVGFISEGWAR